MQSCFHLLITAIIAFVVTGQVPPNQTPGSGNNGNASASTQQPQLGSAPETGKLGNATVVENNPPGKTYAAILPGDPASNNIKGTIYAVAHSDGIGVDFKINITNLPLEGGPFAYHIHDAPVPSGGNCTGTLAHLDPFERGEATICDKSLPQTCQVGDLSGKHGAISTDPFSAAYTDQFASTLPGLGSFFGNRSLTIHAKNKTRLTCANFVLVQNIMSTNTTPENGSNSTSVPFEGSASHMQAVSAFSLGFFLVQLIISL